MTKKLFEVFNTYGKGSGDELAEAFVTEDNRCARQGVLDDWCAYADFYGTAPETFVSGESDCIAFDKDGGDWDDPTGGYIQVTSYEDAVENLTASYNNELEQLQRQFCRQGGETTH